MRRLATERTGDRELHRANELAALTGILPLERREALAALLTDEDVATLKHLAEKGMGPHTLRALASDLGYLEAWTLAATGLPLPWPATEEHALKFLAHHLWDPAERETNPGHGMPDVIASQLKASGYLKVKGPHAPATVRRRLANWATLHRWRGLEPCSAHRPSGPRSGWRSGPTPELRRARVRKRSRGSCSTGCCPPAR